MKVFEIQDHFGFDALKLVERPDPVLGRGKVVVRVRAASLNYRDLLVVQGHYDKRQPLPLVPLSDGAGEVAAIGEGVTRVKVGDRVAGIFAQKWLAGAPGKRELRSTLGAPLDGMLAEMVVLDEDGLVHVPTHLTDEEAATLPCAGVTAWNALMIEGGLKAGDVVLTQGTGGVSIFAVQFARLAGARVIITSKSDDKLARARALGASDGINYKTTPEWDKRARELTQGQGVDHVVELGGAGTFGRALTAVRPGGHISVIGVLSGTRSEVDLIPILMQKLRVQGILVGPRDAFEAMNRAIALHRLRPVIDRVFPFAQAPEALAYMKHGEHFGKICIRMA
jgi:NADPH:quinone reductase-like Zn-dependent oxidoreductase